ncbi:ATP-dependent helicase [Sediminibacillus dalangtanensis]|uniref:ATP-dependent helicase n=1 Tax=Sediminibacillus dalangtanensis TaxID=2729421 RepID=UPI001FD746C2|nr:ATP-dependent helicase [Sediminibacillus dalangtanensis]
MTNTQDEIVKHIDGPLLVTAGPGSGKTRILTERVIKLINSGKKRVLALTFSNRAAEEISNRIEESIDERSQENIFVGTIHSFCLDVVMNRGHLIGLPNGMVILNSEEDKLEIIKKVTSELPEFNNNSPKYEGKMDQLKSYLKSISNYKKQFITPEILLDSNEDQGEFARIYEAYNNMMLAQRALDFDDILFYAYRIFTERPKIARSYTRLYKYICVDEAQDLNATQYKVIRALCVDFNNIMMVGDPAQSIYGFIGSNSDYMTKHFIKDFNPKEYKLSENFRSAKKIIEAAKNIRIDAGNNAVYPLEGELKVCEFKEEEEEATWIANKIRCLIKNGSPLVEEDLRYEDIAIIGRNRYVLTNIFEQLAELDIPFNQGFSSRRIESESIPIKIFEAGLQIIINPYDEVHFNQILNLAQIHPNDNIQTEGNFLDLLLELNGSQVSNENITHFNSIKKAWSKLLDNEENFSKALDILTDNLITTDHNSFEDFENEQYMILKDLDMWRAQWKKYCSQTISGQRSLSHFRNQVSLGKTQTHNTRGVSVLTVHMSKGLEYNVVFLIGMNEGTFPDYRAKSNNALNEESNNMFVALTRAKRICYLTYPRYKYMPWGEMKLQRPSRFINLIDQ